MDVQSAECVVLRQQDFKERDLLVTFLSRERGRMKGIAKGVKKFTGRGVGRYEPLTHGVIFYVEKTGSDLVSIRKCDTLPPYLALQEHYEKYLYAAYFAELLDRCPIAPPEAAAYFDLLIQGLTAIYNESSLPELLALRLRFEWGLLALLGLQPAITVCLHCGKQLFTRLAPAPHTVSPEPHTFDPESGGVRCPDCRVSGRHIAELSAGTLAYLATLGVLGAEPQGTPVRPTRRNLQELVDAITPSLVRQFSRPPKSLSLLPPA